MNKPIPFQKGDKISLPLLKKQIDRRILKITHMVSKIKPTQKPCSDKCCQLTDNFAQTQTSYSFDNELCKPLEQINCNRLSQNQSLISSPILLMKKTGQRQKTFKNSLKNKQNQEKGERMPQTLSFKKSPDRIKISMIINSQPQSQIQQPSTFEEFGFLGNSLENDSLMGSNNEDDFNTNSRQALEIPKDRHFTNCAVYEQCFNDEDGQGQYFLTKNDFNQLETNTNSQVGRFSFKNNGNELETSMIQKNQSRKKKRASSIHDYYKPDRKMSSVNQSFEKIMISGQCKSRMLKEFEQKVNAGRKQCKGNNIRVSLLKRIQQKYLKGK